MVFECESFAELDAPPETWAEAMRALLAGAVDLDEWKPLCNQCVILADLAAECDRGLYGPKGPSQRYSRYWSSAVDEMLVDLAQAQTGVEQRYGYDLEEFVRMGEAADASPYR